MFPLVSEAIAQIVLYVWGISPKIDDLAVAM